MTYTSLSLSLSLSCKEALATLKRYINVTFIAVTRAETATAEDGKHNEGAVIRDLLKEISGWKERRRGERENSR